MARNFMKMAYAPLALMLVVLTLMSVVNATETTPPPIHPGQCNSKDYQCCNLVTFSNDGVIGPLLNKLGVVLTGVAELVGVSCTPIDILGLTQGECQGKPLCCSNRNFNGGVLGDLVGFGVLAVGCVPIEIL